MRGISSFVNHVHPFLKGKIPARISLEKMLLEQSTRFRLKRRLLPYKILSPGYLLITSLCLKTVIAQKKDSFTLPFL